MSQRAFTIRIAAMLLLGTSLPAAAEVYKCVDANGSVTYSDRPVADCETKETMTPPAPVDPTAAQSRAEAREKFLDEIDNERSQQAEEQAKLAKEEGVRQRNCALARDKLARVTGNPRVYGTDEQGNRVKLGEEERQRRIEAAQQDIDTWCK